MSVELPAQQQTAQAILLLLCWCCVVCAGYDRLPNDNKHVVRERCGRARSTKTGRAIPRARTERSFAQVKRGSEREERRAEGETRISLNSLELSVFLCCEALLYFPAVVLGCFHYVLAGAPARGCGGRFPRREHACRACHARHPRRAQRRLAAAAAAPPAAQHEGRRPAGVRQAAGGAHIRACSAPGGRSRALERPRPRFALPI